MIPLLLISLSVVAPFLIINPTAFPFLGIALFLLVLSTLLFSLKKQKSISDYLYYAFIVASTVFIVFRANSFLIFLNIIASIYFGSLLIATDRKGHNLSIIGFVLLPFQLFIEFLKTKNIFTFEWNKFKVRSFESIKISETVLSLFITAVVLAIIVPLLASANPIFDTWVKTVINSLNIAKFIEELFGDYLPMHIIRFILVIIFIFLLPRIASYIHTDKEHIQNSSEITFPLLIPKLMTAVILAVFFASQIQLYTATAETLAALTISHSQYTREVFAQLCVVALIIFGLGYMDKSQSRISKILTYILVAEGIFLTLIAFKSVNDYSTTFGFTHKRLWGYTGVAWMVGAFALFIYSFQKNQHHQKLIGNLAVYSGIILFAVNIANFDYLIYHYKKSVTGEGVDHNYLARTLSSDAYSFSEELSINFQILHGQKIPNAISTYEVLWKIKNLQKKYKELDIRTFNLSEYRQYQSVKDINTQQYEDSIQVIIKKTQPPQPIPIKVIDE